MAAVVAGPPACATKRIFDLPAICRPRLRTTFDFIPMPIRSLIVAALIAACPLAAQHGEHVAVPEGAAAAEVPLLANLGMYSRPAGTSVSPAQLYFDQGVRLTYGFGHEDAARSFREAIRRDPECAMCQWGLAWSLGPYINGPRRDSTSLSEAYEAVQAARRLRSGASEVDRALIDAMAIRYARVPRESQRARLDSAYARAMHEVVRRYPHDLDAATLYGEAMMVLRPWNYWTPDGESQPGTQQILAVLESVLARDIRHPGACHLYIHAVEASPDPSRAAACAELLEDAILGASHVPHMPAHIFMRIGRYGDAVRGNQKARMADLEARDGLAVAIYPTHNLHMLLFAASYDGQSAVAIGAANDLAREAPQSAFFRTLVLARFGRWAELLEMTEPTEHSYARGLWHYGHGLALLRTGRPDSARAHRDALTAQLGATAETATYRGHRQRHLLGMAHGLLAGEIAAAAGEYGDAVSVLRAATAIEDSLRYDEPEPWIVPVRQVLGSVLLQAGRAPEAEQVFRAELRVHPENGWSLAGLEQALRAQGRVIEAGEVSRRFEHAWTRADVRIRGARY
jgi:tetratricopeptide (TPR) repeat protein